eukprot:303689-Karenia_brevis.AAC.1
MANPVRGSLASMATWEVNAKPSRNIRRSSSRDGRTMSCNIKMFCVQHASYQRWVRRPNSQSMTAPNA